MADNLDSHDSALLEALGKHYSTDPDHSPFALTPRMACRLLTQAVMIADTVRIDPEYLTDDDWVLPPVALRQVTTAFLDRFARCFADLAARLHAPGSARRLAACVGDEVALDHILRMARDAHADGTERDVIGNLLDALPASPELDTDFGRYADALFEDRDFELLWRGDLDGIEDDEASQHMRMVNLRPDRWFLPFDGTLDR